MISPCCPHVIYMSSPSLMCCPCVIPNIITVQSSCHPRRSCLEKFYGTSWYFTRKFFYLKSKAVYNSSFKNGPHTTGHINFLLTLTKSCTLLIFIHVKYFVSYRTFILSIFLCRKNLKTWICKFQYNYEVTHLWNSHQLNKLSEILFFFFNRTTMIYYLKCCM